MFLLSLVVIQQVSSDNEPPTYQEATAGEKLLLITERIELVSKTLVCGRFYFIFNKHHRRGIQTSILAEHEVVNLVCFFKVMTRWRLSSPGTTRPSGGRSSGR